MSRKKWANNVVKQQEYRNRLAKKRHEERLSEMHKLGAHQRVTVETCPLCTVTPTQISVTVMGQSVYGPKVYKPKVLTAEEVKQVVQ